MKTQKEILEQMARNCDNLIKGKDLKELEGIYKVVDVLESLGYELEIKAEVNKYALNEATKFYKDFDISVKIKFEEDMRWI